MRISASAFSWIILLMAKRKNENVWGEEILSPSNGWVPMGMTRLSGSKPSFSHASGLERGEVAHESYSGFPVTTKRDDVNPSFSRIRFDSSPKTAIFSDKRSA